MAASFEHVSTSLKLSLNAGTDGEGETITKYLTLSRISSSITAAKADSLAEKIGACLEHTVYAVNKIDNNSVSNPDD